MAAPGLELLFLSVQSDLTRPQDPLVCFIHWELVSHGLRCLGKGESPGAQEEGSERLPQGWSDNKELYTLRYGRNNKPQALLKALTVEGTLIVNILELQTEKVCDLTLNVDEFIERDHLQQYDRVYKAPTELRRRLIGELISPLIGRKEEGQRGEQERDPLRAPPRIPALQPSIWSDPLSHEIDPVSRFPYGAADLDPLRGHSGGMIMDPFRSGRTQPRIDPLAGLPPGAVPPGARFDPFGPVGSGRPGPDPDHLPPPGYDDMFM
ncbi:proteasome inhibitor PI31 subunit [Discoglossus pictus]